MITATLSGQLTVANGHDQFYNVSKIPSVRDWIIEKDVCLRQNTWEAMVSDKEDDADQRSVTALAVHRADFSKIVFKPAHFANLKIFAGLGHSFFSNKQLKSFVENCGALEQLTINTTCTKEDVEELVKLIDRHALRYLETNIEEFGRDKPLLSAVARSPTMEKISLPLMSSPFMGELEELARANDRSKSHLLGMFFDYSGAIIKQDGSVKLIAVASNEPPCFVMHILGEDEVSNGQHRRGNRNILHTVTADFLIRQKSGNTNNNNINNNDDNGE